MKKQLQQTKAGNITAYLIIVISALMGGGSLALFFIFLYAGPINIIQLGLNDIQALWFDFFLCLVFFVQHSSMIRKSFRQRLGRYLQPHYHGAFYAIFSGVNLLLLLIFWQDSMRIYPIFSSNINWLLRLAFILAIIGLVWGARSLQAFDIVGRKKILTHMHKKRIRNMPFTIRGPYRYVRHPFYFFILVMIWSCPETTLDRLLFNCLWSIWIVAGTVLEERDLAVEFGQKYRDYQKDTPMLIPWKICYKTLRT